MYQQSENIGWGLCDANYRRRRDTKQKEVQNYKKKIGCVPVKLR